MCADRKVIVLCEYHKMIAHFVCAYHKVIVLCMSTGGAETTRRCGYSTVIVLGVLVARCLCCVCLSQGDCAVCAYGKVIVLCVSTGGAGTTGRCGYIKVIVLCVFIAR